MRPWQTTMTSPRRSGEPWKEYVGEACPHGLEIVLVDGSHVRDVHDSDFSQGGNGHRYDFVPRDEIWIDACIGEDERPLVAFHECVEAELMRRGQSYSRAHDRAKMLEDRLRRGGDPMPRKKPRKKRARLSPRARELASQFIAEEHRTKKYPREQAIAIGLSRARREAAKEKFKLDTIVAKYL